MTGGIVRIGWESRAHGASVESPRPHRVRFVRIPGFGAVFYRNVGIGLALDIVRGVRVFIRESREAK